MVRNTLRQMVEQRTSRINITLLSLLILMILTSYLMPLVKESLHTEIDKCSCIIYLNAAENDMSVFENTEADIKLVKSMPCLELCLKLAEAATEDADAMWDESVISLPVKHLKVEIIRENHTFLGGTFHYFGNKEEGKTFVWV